MKSPRGSARDIRRARPLTIWVPIALLIASAITAAISGCGSVKLSPTAAQAQAGAGVGANSAPVIVASPVRAKMPRPIATATGEPAPRFIGYDPNCKPLQPVTVVSKFRDLQVTWSPYGPALDDSHSYDSIESVNPAITHQKPVASQTEKITATWTISPFMHPATSVFPVGSSAEYSVVMAGGYCAIYTMAYTTTATRWGGGGYERALSVTAVAGTIAWVHFEIEENPNPSQM